MYRHIKPQLMFGYALIGYQGQTYKIAEVEKAILDYFYLNPHLSSEHDFDGLRFNAGEFSRQADRNKLSSYLNAFGNKSLTKRVNKFLRHIHYD